MSNKTFQSQNRYTKFLPYFEELEKHADQELNDIVSSLKDLRKSILNMPDICKWTRILDNYIIKHGFRFSQEDHLWLVNYFYQLLTAAKNIDKATFDEISSMTAKLLSKDYLLLSSDLQLDWKPLSQLIEDHHYSPYVYRNLVPKPNISTLKTVVANARPFFKPEATKEMMDEWRPYLNFHNSTSMDKGIQFDFVCAFLLRKKVPIFS